MIDIPALQREIRERQDPPHTLPTPRQIDVVRLMADGLSDHEIAEALGISDGTAKTHAGDLLHRTHTHNRAHAVALCIRRGWI